MAIVAIKGNQGILKRAQNSAEIYENSEAKEENILGEMENRIGEEIDNKFEAIAKIVTSDKLFTIKAEINVSGNSSNLNLDKCKYVFTQSQDKIGKDISKYVDGNITGATTTIEKVKGAGTWYLHALVTDNSGNSKEIVSDDSATVDLIKNFEYTGNIQTVTLQPGYYNLEVWGAQGGDKTPEGTTVLSEYTGVGGYSTGVYKVTSEQTLYVCVGGAGYGGINTYCAGGYNGGGGAYGDNSGEGGNSGGGATHIATKSGILSSLESDKSSVLIVAGGGGGAGEDNEQGGPGGGYQGGGGYGNTGSYGTQSGSNGSYPGSFGQGKDTHTNGGGAGGGWYGAGTPTIVAQILERIYKEDVVDPDI